MKTLINKTLIFMGLKKSDSQIEYLENISKYKDMLYNAGRANKLLENKNELDNIINKVNNSEQIKIINKLIGNKIFNQIINDERITEDEISIINNFLSYSNLETKDISFDQNKFNKYRSLSLIDDGLLPVILEENIVSHDGQSIYIPTKNNEQIHFVGFSALRKEKIKTTRVNYSGLTSSVKIFGGLRYRAGSMKFDSIKSNYIDNEDVGILYITSNKIGFIGKKKSIEFNINKISSFEIMQYGLSIIKINSSNPYIFRLEDYEVPINIISYILK